MVVQRWTLFISKPYEVKRYLLQQLLAASQSGEAIGFRHLLYATLFDTVKLEIVINYFVYSQSVNASFTWDLTIQSVHFWIVFLTEHNVFDILSVLVDTHTKRGLPLPGCVSIEPVLRIFFNKVSILPHFEHLLWACLTDSWIERTYVLNKILFYVVYSQNNMLLTAKLVIFCVLWFPKVR